MNRRLLAALLLLAIPLAAQQPSPRDLFERARILDESNRSLDEAIAIYGQVAAQSADRTLAATAQLRIALLYERLGRPADAQRAFRVVVDRYGDQGELARQARTKLPASPSPSTPQLARRVWAGTDVDFMGAVSDDGRYLTYVDWEFGDLAIRDLRSGQNRRLTQKAGVAQYSALSPDGSQVAYSLGERLRLIPFEGGVPRVLYANDDIVAIGPLQWAPDGRSLVVVLTRRDQTKQLATIAIADGSSRILKTFDWRSPGIAVSPDGRFIAYSLRTVSERPEQDLFLIASDGSREVPLVTHPSDDFGVDWAPDGTRIVFVSDRTGANSLWALRISDGRPQGEPELLKPDIGRVGGWGRITKTGDFYYGINIGVQDVFVAAMDPETGTIVEPPTPLRGRFFGGKFAAAWSADGEHLAYISQTPQQLAASGRILSIHTLKTGEVRDLFLPLSYANSPVWMPDGRAVLVWGPDLRGLRGIHRVDLSTGTLARLVPGPARDTPEPGLRPVALSADATRLLYWVGTGQGTARHLRMRHLESGEDREVWPEAVADFAVSPDGRWVALRPAQEQSIYVIPVSGGQPRALLVNDASEPGDTPLVWSHDGKYLLFSRSPRTVGLVPGQGPHELWRVPVAAGTAQKLDVTLPAIARVSVHPDGRRLAISAGSPEFEVWMIEKLVPAVSATERQP